MKAVRYPNEDKIKDRKNVAPLEDFKKEFHVGNKADKGLAVDKALEQRENRIVQKRNKLAAERIQSSFRAYISNRRLVDEQKAILEKRLSDLMVVSKLLAKQNQSFCPPPSLVSLLLNQMLFVMHSRPRKRKNRESKSGIVEFQYFSMISKYLVESDAKIIARVIEFAVIPGLLSSDRNLDPSPVWIQSAEGKLKLIKLMRLCIYLISARQGSSSVRSDMKKESVASKLAADEDAMRVVYKMILTIIGRDETEPEVGAFCRKLFFSSLGHADHPITIGRRPIREENLDLISLLRTFLLFPSGMKINVIPRNVDSLREKSISAPDRSRADGFFNMISNIALERDDAYIKSRLFAEIFTVPLLTWRLQQRTIDSIVGKGGEDENAVNPPCITFLDAFLKFHEGKDLFDISGLLPFDDVPITICPSPPMLSLCANMSQLGTTCPLIYDIEKIHINVNVAIAYFKFMSLLVENTPLGSFSSRESEIGWIEEGSRVSPVVISSIVRDQCKILLTEDFVRKIFRIALDFDPTDVDQILGQKDERDMKIEEELKIIQTESVLSVAAKEAMIDHSTGFWKKSKWAKNLSKKLTSFLPGSKKVSRSNDLRKEFQLSTSGLSRNQTTQSCEDMNIERKLINKIQRQELLFCLTRTYAIIVSRWGGYARDIINTSATAPATKVMERLDSSIIPVLNVLCFSTSYLKISWALIQSNDILKKDLCEMVDVKKRPFPIRATNLFASSHKGEIDISKNTGSAFLLLLLSSLAHSLIVTDDVELHDLEAPLPKHQILRCVLLLKSIVHRACCFDVNVKDFNESNHVGLSLINLSAKILRDLYDRSSRRLLCPPKLWLIDDLMDSEIRKCKTYEDYWDILNHPILRVCPFFLSFKLRLKLFDRLTTTNRESVQGRNDGHSFRPGVHINIMRGRLIEDGLTHLNKLRSNLRQRLIVQYVNSAGAAEVGLDAGGLFKEFWSDLSNQSFNPHWALFRETEDGFLYPNPSSNTAHGSDDIVLFEFLGRILGKAIYENITIKPQFAHFFLSYLRGDYNFLHMLPDLSTMDKTLYNNLMFLKTYDGDAKDLCLTFAVSKDDFGSNEEISLISGGENIEVTNLNKHRYIEMVAKYYVCDRIKDQSEAFRRGLWDVIEKKWLQIFNEPELQVVISGPNDGSIDIEDMKANTKLVGGYTVFDTNINRFWRVVKSFNGKQRAQLLRFVTSCERPPPLGFASMNPPFTIQRIPFINDDQLPTASTCFNILKLPAYTSEKILRDRLLYSIQSCSGFELT
eukprot:CAMPEP_0176505780 /NCGR_PEP_ID=MMETSP0200_2-20121128/16685_1 /TAXON_ID=947934 /ORGANISM="Chaetoceros sp., Strain GSL56" /LENGTH=1269 /DNA_ID=CAMNT_0017905373 /DNA_START=111 /DNA_END=3920 /DNA_ORIENTATION=+